VNASGEVLGRAVARAAEHQLAGAGLGGVDQLLHAFDRLVVAHHDDEARRGDLPDRVECLQRVEARRLGHHRRDDLARRHDAERVAILGRVGDRLVAEQPASAGPVLDHDRLAKLFLHALADDAADDVGAAAGAERNDDLDGLGGVVLRSRGGGQRGQHEG
jgi:hypothetical protein